MQDEPELRQLIERAKVGDREALSLIYESYYDRIYRYALARVRIRETAEDLAGQTCLRVVEQIDHFEWRGGGFTAWMFRIAHNLIMDWFRNRRETPLADLEILADTDPCNAMVNNEALAEALWAVNQLCETQRQVLLLRLVAGLSGRETAETLGLSEANVRTLQHRALTTVRDKLRVKIDV